jgi:hypothetical protein
MGGGSPSFFKETHTPYSSPHYFNIAAGRHLGPEKDGHLCFCIFGTGIKPAEYGKGNFDNSDI